jgi:hypothetical protein
MVESAKILGLATRLQKTKPAETLKGVYDIIKDLPTIEELPKLEALTGEAQFMKLQDRREFKDMLEMKVNPKQPRIEGSKLSDELRYILALPNGDISAEWVDTRVVEEYLKSKKATDSSLLLLMGTGKGGEPTHVPVHVAELNGKGIRAMLEKQPEMRAWAYYQSLLGDSTIKDENKQLLRDRLRDFRPSVVEMPK